MPARQTRVGAPPVGVTGVTTRAAPRLVDERPTLQRLTLNVSDRCPLACHYCYANGGAYDTAGVPTSARTALAAVNFAARHYASVMHVNFFGGEPTLNPRSDPGLVCEYVTYLHRRGLLTQLPSFGLTTSGFRMSQRVAELVADHHIGVTVSADSAAPGT